MPLAASEMPMRGLSQPPPLSLSLGISFYLSMLVSVYLAPLSLQQLALYNRIQPSRRRIFLFVIQPQMFFQKRKKSANGAAGAGDIESGFPASSAPLSLSLSRSLSVSNWTVGITTSTCDSRFATLQFAPVRAI